MKALFSTLVLAGTLVGCGTPKVVTEIQTVEVPVTVFCKVKDVKKPELPFDTKARKDMTLFEKTKLLAAQDKVQKGYIKELEGAIAGCRAPIESE